jgi:hypothetical protein
MVDLDKGLFKELFTEKGKINGLKNLDKKRGEASVTFKFKVPKGEDEGSGTITRRDDDTVVANYKGSLMEGNNRFKWESDETGEVVVEDGKEVIKGSEKVRFTDSPGRPDLFMMTKMSPSTEDFTNIVSE